MLYRPYQQDNCNPAAGHKAAELPDPEVLRFDMGPADFLEDRDFGLDKFLLLCGMFMTDDAMSRKSNRASPAGWVRRLRLNPTRAVCRPTLR